MTRQRTSPNGDSDPALTHLGHHFETPSQQLAAAKLGMWTFLATEILMFGGLFCAYAVYRRGHPEMFAAGSQFLNTKLGAINTSVLLLSSFTMAWAVRATQLDRRWTTVMLLSLTLLGAAGFMGVKYVEYKEKWEHGLAVGKFFHPDEAFFAAHFAKTRASEAPTSPHDEGPPVANLERGKAVYLGTCASCHGPTGAGLPKQGANLRDSTFVAHRDDQGLTSFLKVGRQAWDQDSTLKLTMPARGGNPMLTDEDLWQAAAYVRELQRQADAAPANQEQSPADATAQNGQSAGVSGMQEAGLLSIGSTIPPAAAGPMGLSPDYLLLRDRQVAQVKTPPQPAELRLFFAIYFALTGLHGVHVIVGMGLIAWLIVRAARGQFGSRYYTPVELGGLYWHLVDLIWIFLFPLLYLIH